MLLDFFNTRILNVFLAIHLLSCVPCLHLVQINCDHAPSEGLRNTSNRALLRCGSLMPVQHILRFQNSDISDCVIAVLSICQIKIFAIWVIQSKLSCEVSLPMQINQISILSMDSVRHAIRSLETGSSSVLQGSLLFCGAFLSDCRCQLTKYLLVLFDGQFHD